MAENNDASFFRPDLLICDADALRQSHEEQFYSGDINVRMAVYS
jgi:predicted GTPase